jgi:phosphoribosylaminoimidazole-succinocarboxamide synthase
MIAKKIGNVIGEQNLLSLHAKKLSFVCVFLCFVMAVLSYSDIPNATLFRRGKVRDVYEAEYQGKPALVMIASDRISAFDVVMDQPIPGKGAILTGISQLWFAMTKHLVPNHLLSVSVNEYPQQFQAVREQIEGRSMLVKKTQPLPIECVVRGYLAGSGWKEYQAYGMVCGIALPEHLQLSSKLPEPIFTPATKAETGHDENISYTQAREMFDKIPGGIATLEKARAYSLALYQFAAEYAEARGIILADTKFEFGVDDTGALIVIDEVLTPDSSRFWLQSAWQPGAEQQNFDKQILRDYLETLDWNKQYPPPHLPDDILQATAKKYQEALNRLSANNTVVA